MNQSTFFRRTAVIGAAALALTARRVGAQSTPVASPVGSPTADVFPVSIDHIYGTTTIESVPTRVVTWGWSSQDAVIALGVIPAGIPADTWAGDAEGFLPWTRTAIGDAALPTTLGGTTAIPFEAIVELQPDLILAPYSGITEDEYSTLAAIAPTVAPITALWSSSWQEVTRIAGLALGRSAEAEQLIAETDALVADEAAKYPDLAGKTFLYGSMGDGTTSFSVYLPTDQRSQLLESMGLVPAQLAQDLADDPANVFFGTLCYELAQDLVADIVVFWFTDRAEYEKATATPYYQGTPAVANGTFAAIVGREYVIATSALSTLSIEFALAEYLPALAAAAANVK